MKMLKILLVPYFVIGLVARLLIEWSTRRVDHCSWHECIEQRFGKQTWREKLKEDLHTVLCWPWEIKGIAWLMHLDNEIMKRRKNNASSEKM